MSNSLHTQEDHKKVILLKEYFINISTQTSLKTKIPVHKTFPVQKPQDMIEDDINNIWATDSTKAWT